MVYTDQRTKAFHQIVFEASLVDSPVCILYSSSTMSLILIELSFIHCMVLIANSSFTCKCSSTPNPSIFSFRRMTLISPLSLWLIPYPLPFITITISRQHSPTSFSNIIFNLSLIVIPICVQYDQLSYLSLSWYFTYTCHILML